MSSMMPILVLGGARSGKSAFAEQLLRESNVERTYLATATAGDDEMKARIAHHRLARCEKWHTIEEPLAIVEALRRETGKGHAVLVDCLTLWLSNLFMDARNVELEIEQLALFLQEAPRNIVLVSNEIGLGLVPETKLGRDFRDAQGRLNQRIAAAVPRVVFVAAGLPLYLKGSA
ncbi:bifunctional adenosylcobinamide kinase/adenosylcobinamide-phosphate guanylyltransferase [Methyloferula stellata]|uniref:bifunctional adenosylcobinamide kinase/adenosylcobinamide-phosphate guanylyltransferase n=1 Tax=Methyloferula stellata TaxID=876270 RepID=UPI00047D55F0|nr:bifunctional adenosylcobinamide kinase/adenosylcobinamide-phosphate guanylyltransferase [Methyloferula stellata]